MKILKAAAFAAIVLPLLANSASAAQTFDWSLTGPTASPGGFPLTENGHLTATTSGAGVWTVDTLSFAGSDINSLTSFEGSDNLIYTNGFASLDTSGLSFVTAAGEKVNIFSFFSQGTPPTGNAYGELASNPSGFGVGTFTLTAVPEPSIWAMLLAGIGLMGAALRFNRRRSHAFDVTAA